MAKGKRKKQQNQFKMDADSGGDWMTGPIGDGGEEMDTKEPGTGAGAPLITGPPQPKQKPGPRGKRTAAQKKRKASKMKRALAVADRVDAKAGHRAAATMAKKSSKSLWPSGKKAK